LDDGAGTVVCLEAARVLAGLPPGSVKRTVRFVLFCGEEVGLFGSWAYTAAHEDEAGRTRFVLNLDTAGRGKGGSESLALTRAPAPPGRPGRRLPRPPPQPRRSPRAAPRRRPRRPAAPPGPPRAGRTVTNAECGVRNAE